MSTRGLQKIVGKAVISDHFRDGLLGERRAELIGGFDLEPDELDKVMAIQVETLAEFAGAIEEIAGPRHDSSIFDHVMENRYRRLGLPVAEPSMRE